MIKTLGIPVLNRGDLLRRCLESVDHPFERLLVINNGKDPSVLEVLRKLERRELGIEGYFEKISVETPARNLGCGPSWNRIITSFPGSWLITGNDVQFKPGSLARIAQVEETTPDADIVCADGYSVFVMTPGGRRKVGLFDENFYPAYHEDCDHWRRVVLSGAKAVNVPGFEFIHGEAPNWGSCTINADPGLKEFMGKRLAELRAYYERKWGGTPGAEKFSTPFNRPVPLHYWER
jgi:GT2 family glycosyltransferase